LNFQTLALGIRAIKLLNRDRGRFGHLLVRTRVKSVLHRDIVNFAAIRVQFFKSAKYPGS
jgi:hypothetical protein